MPNSHLPHTPYLTTKQMIHPSRNITNPGKTLFCNFRNQRIILPPSLVPSYGPRWLLLGPLFPLFKKRLQLCK